MKTIVLEADVHEGDIKPQALLDEYRAKLAEDVRERFADRSRFQACPCPGCGGQALRPAFEKLGLAYAECTECGTVFVSPRPDGDLLVSFHRDAASSRFWRERIGVQTRELRREKVFRPRADWVLDTIDRYRPNARRIVVAGYHGQLLVSELCRQAVRPLHYVAANPIADIEFDHLALRNLEIRPTRLADLHQIGPADLVLAFDLLDRLGDVDAAFAAARDVIPVGGIFAGSTTLSTGFDLQVLWERSHSIYPPERLTLLSVEGLQLLAARHGFEALELSTPGMFDVDIVARALDVDAAADIPRVIRYWLRRRDERLLTALQEFLQQNRLSSFARFALRRVD